MYSVVKNHIGKSAALNSSTTPLATRSGLEANTRMGTSGACANRDSISTNTPSSARPSTIGPSAAAELHPSLPAVTMP
jgi:hypothetical protein